MQPLLNVVPKLSFIGIVDVRVLPAFLSLSFKGKVWGAMHDEPSLTHCFPCQAHCQATPNFELYAIGGDGDKVQFCAQRSPSGELPFLVICMLMPSNRDGGLR